MCCWDELHQRFWWTNVTFVVADNGSIAATLVSSLYELRFTNNPFMLQRLHLVSFLGVKNMGITDIKRELRLYFIQQLAKDELVRSGNMLNPDFYYIPNSEGIGLLANVYREALRNENSQSLDRAIEVAKAFDRSTNVNSSDY